MGTGLNPDQKQAQWDRARWPGLWPHRGAQFPPRDGRSFQRVLCREAVGKVWQIIMPVMAHGRHPSPRALLTGHLCHSLWGEICEPMAMAEMALCATPKARLKRQHSFCLESSSPLTLWKPALQPSCHVRGCRRQPAHRRTTRRHPCGKKWRPPQPADLWVGEPSDDSSPALEPLKWDRATVSLLGPAQAIDS